MKRKWTVVPLIVLAVAIGLPVATVLIASICFSFMDKTNGSLVSSGITRRYLLYVPKSYERTKPTPLVISIHPAATWPAVEMNLSRWNELADRQGFIVVYPAGSGAFFGGFGPGPHVWPGGRNLARDVKFISDLIDKLEADYNIDRNRIYVSGMSNGGGMAFALSCALPDRIAAVGTVAPALPPRPGGDECRDSSPMPLVAFHGTADKMAPYLGGKSPVAPRPFPSIPAWIDQVAQRNKCEGGPVTVQVSPSVRRVGYSSCTDNADVILYTIQDGGHTWPGGKPLAQWIAGRTTNEINASKIMWDFFVQHPHAAKQ